MGSGDLAALVRICDPEGRPRGTGFLADHEGTLLTSHEAVDGLARLVLGAPGGPARLVEAAAVTPLPELGLALVRTEGLGVRPLPIATRPAVEPGTYVRIAAHGRREARVLGPATVTYTAAGRRHTLADALELAIGTEGAEALRLGGEPVGGPVLDAATGTVLAVLGSALRGEPGAAGHAVPLRADGPLAAVLGRNAATVPAYGPDLNLAAVLELTATAPGPPRDPAPWPAPVDRPGVLAALTRLVTAGPPVAALVGAPGTGRTTALAALRDRRARGSAPAPTVWLRGADLGAGDGSVADAVGRVLRQAGRIVAASGAAGDPAAATPERAAALARAAGRPLLVVLDGPEEMPPLLAHRLPAWTGATEAWLRAHGARLVLACRPEHAERAAGLWSAPPAVLPLGDLTETEARAVRQGYGIGEGDLAPADARHPLALRLLAEVRAALPGDVPGRPGREEILTAHLDLMCLRIAVRIAAGTRPLPRGTAVRRLAARVAGQVHEAARRCLGPGHGVLDRASFEELFPWRAGWAPAVLTEGLLVPAGSGYRFAHEELADWVQAAHLDLDGALHALVHRWHEDAPAHLPARPGPTAAAPAASAAHLPVPRHRIGPVLEALLLLHRTAGPAAVVPRLTGLADALARFAAEGAAGEGRAVTEGAEGEDGAVADGVWWGSRLLTETLRRVGDLRPYLPVLRHLADRVGAHPAGAPALAAFGPAFWQELPVREDERLDLLRRLVPADPPRHLDAAAALLTADPRGVQPLLCRWLADERPLPGEPGATVATAARELLHTHRSLAVDDLCEALVATAHPLADGLLAALAEDEPSALCRAVDRWAHDDGRPERRAAAVTYAELLADRVTGPAEREPLRYAALALLARPGDDRPHATALGLLVRDPHTRPRYLPRALADPRVPAAALTEALATDPDAVLAALRDRLRGAGPEPAAVLRALAPVDTPALTRRVAALVREYVARHPEGAPHAADYVDRRLEEGPTARAVLFPLVTGLIRGRPAVVRRALAPVLAAPGSGASRHLRAELLDVLLTHEAYEAEAGEHSVLDALLVAAAIGAARRSAPRTRELVARTVALYARVPGGSARCESLLAALAEARPHFAALLVEALPAPRRPGSSMPMPTDGPGHGSLRPA